MIENTKRIDTLAHLILILGIAFILSPIVVALITSTQSYEGFIKNGGISLSIGNAFWCNLQTIFYETQLPKQLINSFIVAFLVAVIKCCFAFWATFALIFYQSKFNRIIFMITIGTVLMPIELIVITAYEVVSNVATPFNWLLKILQIDHIYHWITGSGIPLFELNLLDTYIGVAAPLATSSTAVFIYRQFFLSLPKDLARAAVMDGAGAIRFMIDILIPIAKTPLIATFLLWFIGAWTSYLWPLLASTTPESQTAVVGLARMVDSEEGVIPNIPLSMTGALFVSFIPVLIIAAMQRKIVSGMDLSEK